LGGTVLCQNWNDRAAEQAWQPFANSAGDGEKEIIHRYRQQGPPFAP
jgi:hypothetical protein